MCPARELNKYVNAAVVHSMMLISHPQTNEFERVYDARERFGAKASMKRWPTEKLKKNDLVLMEVQISRYNTAKEKDAKNGKTKNVKPQDLTAWQTTFDLIAVSVLELGPTVIEEEMVPDITDADFAL